MDNECQGVPSPHMNQRVSKREGTCMRDGDDGNRIHSCRAAAAAASVASVGGRMYARQKWWQQEKLRVPRQERGDGKNKGRGRPGSANEGQRA